MTFRVVHPAFGIVTFCFDDAQGDSGFAASEGFVFLGVPYPKFDFAFRREGAAYVSCELNDLKSQLFEGRRLTASDVAPIAFRSFVLSKAKELASTLAPC